MNKIAIINLLDKYPLYQNLDNKDDLKITIIGNSELAYSFLDQVLVYSQNLVNKLIVNVYKMDKDDYLKDKPSLSQFFNVNKSISEDDYGIINFYNGEIDNSIYESNYIFIDSILLNLLDIQSISNKTTLVVANNNELFVDNIKISNKLDDDLDRQGFNVHLCYLNTKSEYNLIDARKQYIDEEHNNNNMLSSLSFACSIKYKLHTIEIENIFDLDLINDKLNDSDSTVIDYLEHKRWVTYHLVNGWSNFEDDIIGNAIRCADSKDKINKLHCCILKDPFKTRLSVNDSLFDKGDIINLDPLDKLSINLHRRFNEERIELRKRFIDKKLEEYNTLVSIFVPYPKNIKSYLYKYEFVIENILDGSKGYAKNMNFIRMNFYTL